MIASTHQLNNIFFCLEESNFYSYCLERLILSQVDAKPTSIIEFGSGDGSPVVDSLLRTKFNGVVHGFEINPSASRAARAKIEECELSDKYFIHNSSFFDASKPQAEYLISNPPYLPAIDNKIYQPYLHGGLEGITVTKQLLELGYENVLVMVSSYSNPVGLIDYALASGYSIANFLVSPLAFGYYSSEPKVKNRIAELKQENKAFYSKNTYLLAGVLFTKQHNSGVDLSSELVQLMTCL